MRIFATALLAALLPLTAASQTPANVQMDKSFIRFVSKQMNVPVEGRFKKFTANLSFDAKKPEASRAEFEIELASVDLGSPEAETEVKRKSWFNTEAFPKAKFVSASVKSLGGDRIEVTGPLSIKGASINITTVATVKTDAAGVSVAEGKFPLKRLAYKIGEGQWADTDTVADEVEVRYRFTFSSKK
jgi:polyisoprenoid-binding protein YceI